MSEVSEVSEVCRIEPFRDIRSPLDPSRALLSSPEITPRAIQSEFSRTWYTSDTSDTWGFEVSEVSEVSWMTHFRHFRHFRHLGV